MDAHSYNIWTMNNHNKGDVNPQIYHLWTSLLEELEDNFDAHYICATVAGEVSQFAGAKTVVGVTDSLQDHYDVWIGQPDQETEQVRWPVDKVSFAKVQAEEGAVHLAKMSQPVKELVDNELWLLAEEQVLAIALPVHESLEQPVLSGALFLIDAREDGPIGSTELEFLSRNLAVYMDRAALQRQVVKQDVEFGVVSDISHVLSSTLSMDSLFDALTGTIRRILQVESLSVGLTEQGSGDIVFVESLMGAKFDNLPVIRVKPGQGIAGWVAENGEPVIVNDVYADQRFYAAPDRQSGFKTRSMICIPLQVENNTIGVLQAINRRYGQFTAHDLSLLQALSGPLAAAVENSKLHSDVLFEKRRVETILAGMFEGLLAVTLDGTITRANDAFLALMANEELLVNGKKAEDVVQLEGGDVTALIETIRQQETDAVQLAADLRRSNGELVPVLISGAPTFSDSGGVTEVILTFSDLTQIREVERMRDDLFHAIAHELRTPLATILMYARLLLEGKAQDAEKAERFLGVIERESNRLQHMVRRMMQLAKQEAREFHRSPEPVRLNPLFDDVLSPLSDLAVQKGLLFRQNIEPDLPIILGDEERLEEIVQNLVGNAIKFSPSGTVRVEACEDSGQVVITVNDQGIGISRQALPYLFDRFYRAQAAVDRGIAGSGLGLYMVKQSVEQYNGSISVDSQEDIGTTFTLSFPVYEL